LATVDVDKLQLEEFSNNGATFRAGMCPSGKG